MPTFKRDHSRCHIQTQDHWVTKVLALLEEQCGHLMGEVVINLFNDSNWPRPFSVKSNQLATTHFECNDIHIGVLVMVNTNPISSH